MDGTFKIAPAICQQLYTIHGFYMGECFPFAFAVLQNKDMPTYLRLFNLLKQSAADQELLLAPQRIIVDFESAAIQALQIAFPNSETKGCLFHYSQCIWKKVK
jgi:hypothetical protein